MTYEEMMKKREKAEFMNAHTEAALVVARWCAEMREGWVRSRRVEMLEEILTEHRRVGSIDDLLYSLRNELGKAAMYDAKRIAEEEAALGREAAGA